MSVSPSENSRKSQAAGEPRRKLEPMNRRVQIAVLVGLLAILPLVAYEELGSQVAKAARIAISEDVALLQVEDPELRLDLLEHLKKLKYDATHRNIFSFSTLLPVATLQPPVVANPVPPAPPPGPPPLVVPAQFFGYVTDVRTGVRRAFFKQDEDGYVLGVGELLAGRFRLVQIGDSTAELEETATGRRTALPMEDGPAEPSQNQVGFPQGPAGGGSSPPSFRPAQPGQNQVSFPQVSTGVESSPPGFRPAQPGQKPAGFAQMPIGGGPSLLVPQLVPVPASMNPLR
jgi:hypothetical protein